MQYSGLFVKQKQWERFNGRVDRGGTQNKTLKASRGGQWGMLSRKRI